MSMVYPAGPPPRPPVRDTPGPGPGRPPGVFSPGITPAGVAHVIVPQGVYARRPSRVVAASMPAPEYTQGYTAPMPQTPTSGQPVIPGSPTGIADNTDDPGMYPTGIVPAVATTGNSIAQRGVSQQPRPSQQYAQRYAEGFQFAAPFYIAGLRGIARTVMHLPDPLIQPTLGPVLETNRGYPYTWLRTVVKSFKPSQEFQSVFVNGKAVAAKKFHAMPIAEINSQRAGR